MVSTLVNATRRRFEQNAATRGRLVRKADEQRDIATIARAMALQIASKRISAIARDSSVLSNRSWFSVLSHRSAFSAASTLSIGSVGSVGSIGSAGALCSIGSAVIV